MGNLSYIIYLSLFCIATATYFTGIHNMDNGQNLRMVNAWATQYNLNVSFSDNSLLREYTPDGAYMSGMTLNLVGGIIYFVLGLNLVLSVKPPYNQQKPEH